MTTITLTGNTNVSALSLANGDTIDLAGFQLTFDAQPSNTNIQVTSPGSAGSVVFSAGVTITIPTWNFTAGTRTSAMIATLPAICEIGNATGGSVFNAACVDNNLGRIAGNATAGNANSARAVIQNNGTIVGNVIGGGAAAAYAIATNFYQILGNVSGGTANVAAAIQENRGTIFGNVTGGSGTSASGVQVHFGLILGLAKAGTGASSRAVDILTGQCIGGIENTGAINALGTVNGSTMIVDGPKTKITFPSKIQRIYSLYGPLNSASTIPAGATVIELRQGGDGFTGILGLGRGVGT